jgi:S-DNA-T family DNA segregation ATPase FtsK/SpoIIIE
MLERVVAEMNRRIQRGGNWDPLVAIVDEAQVAYMCPAKGPDGRPYGGSKNTSRFLTAVRQIQNQGRAVDVLLWEGTQDPTNQNLPILAREGAHLRICLAVGTEEKSRMALGDNAVEGGAAPHRLRPGLDKGTVVVAGDGAPLAAGQASVTIRTHFIDDKDATTIANRAKKLRGPLVPRPPEQERDLLEDVFELMGDADQVPAATMARLLHPVDRRYAAMDGVQLKARLDDLGALVTKNKGVATVYRSRVEAAMEARGECA